MKTVLKEIITNRPVIWTLIGCLLFLGTLQLFVVKGCHNSKVKTVLEVIQPDTPKEVLISRESMELPPFPEPSLEGLVQQLKTELGVVSGTVTSEEVAQTMIDSLNFMDTRSSAEEVASAWIKRKRQVIANPELLRMPGFVLPPIIDTQYTKVKPLYDYDVKLNKHFKITREQQERIYALRDQSQRGEISADEYSRENANIKAEKLDLLTAAMYFLTRASARSPHAELGMEYAERVIRENPNSFEAHHIWALCNNSFNHTDREKVYDGFRQLIMRFPNVGIAHRDFAMYATLHDMYPEEALAAAQRATQLDPRISPYNSVLARCYGRLGDYEKAVVVYQGMPYISIRTRNILFVYQARAAEKRQENAAAQKGEEKP